MNSRSVLINKAQSASAVEITLRGFLAEKAENLRTGHLIQPFTEGAQWLKSICGCTLPLKMRNSAVNRTRHYSSRSHVWIMGEVY